MRAKDGSYAGLAFFENPQAAATVLEHEMSSPACVESFAVMELPAEDVPDMGVLSFDRVKIYDLTWPHH